MGYPLVYELNTRCWLRKLSPSRSHRITLAEVPDQELVRWAELGLTHLWLMGVWQIAPASVAFSRMPARRREWRRLVPDVRTEEITGSPYAISGYTVDPALGGEAALARFRAQLHAHGLKLLLDFIPNHTGLDHPWVALRPDLFIHSTRRRVGAFQVQTAAGPLWIAHGKDPYFPPWADTAQLDYRNPATQEIMIAELKSVAQRCDGVRCDMAMLVLQEVFQRHWAKWPAPRELCREEFWPTAIEGAREVNPEFLFLAEAYWDLESTLLAQGFDFAYAKHLLDLLVARNPASVTDYLRARPARDLERSAHFLENHDEPRVAARLSVPEHKAAALLVLSLPGMRLLHEGQFTGATQRTPVHLSRGPPEQGDQALAEFYRGALRVLLETAVGRGTWKLLEAREAWPGNPTASNLVLVSWQAHPHLLELVVVNLADHCSQCRVFLELDPSPAEQWKMRNLLGSETYVRQRSELCGSGLFLDVPAHGAQLFRFEPQPVAATVRK